MSRRIELAIVVALATAASVWWTWGALQPLPVVQDEYSYVLQSRILARGEWTAPPPPAQYSFQQPHVLTAPRVASKFPPGHALLLAPAAALGAPWLGVLLLSGITAAILLLLAESQVGTFAALVCWAVWLTDPINLRFRPGYYSEVTSGLMWLATWWLLRRWWRSDERRWLVYAALTLGWMAITRPLTALAFAAPVGIAVVVRANRERLWPHVGAAVIAGALVVGILPLWSKATTGRWTETPTALYRREYLPFDKPGFGIDSTPPARRLTPVNADVYAEFAVEHREYTPARLGAAAVARLRDLGDAEFSSWRLALVPVAVIGLIAATAELWFAVACGAALFAGYLSYGHYHGWTLYYFEALPVVALCVGNGVAVCAAWLRRRRWPGGAQAALGAAAAAILVACGSTTVAHWRRRHVDDAAYDTGFRAMLARAPFPAAVVFVRYSRDQHPHTTVVANSPTLSTDPVWVVNDDPGSNGAVMRAAKGRVPLLYEERGARLSVYGSLIDSARGPVASAR